MNKILFVDSKESFVIKGISENLIKEGYDCSVMPLSLNLINKIDIPGYVFINIYEDADKNVEELKYLNEVCHKNERKIFLMGFREDIEKIEAVFDKRIIAECYYRPANAGQIVTRLKDILDNGGASHAKKHILLVDDSGTLLNSLKGWLEGEYKVSMVNSAVNALFFLANNVDSIDLILLDFYMPVCSGAQLFEMLRSEPKTRNIPIIFLTGIEEEETMNEVLRLSPEGYLVKSMSREGILSQIQAFFDKN